MSTITELMAARRTEIICAATAAAGPGASKQDIADRVRIILELHAADSPIESIVYTAERRAEQLGEVKRFTGTVIHLDLEEGSNRAVVVLQSGSTQTPEAYGQQVLRTHRLDGNNVEAQEAKSIANRIQGVVVHPDGTREQVGPGLIGHRVAVTVGVATRNGRKYATLIDLADRGVDGDYDPNDPRFVLSPNHKVDFGKWQSARTFMGR